MDDGSVKSSQSKGVYFNTQSFSMSDVDRLCDVLQTKFNIDAVSKNEKIEMFSFFCIGNVPIQEGIEYMFQEKAMKG